jgi:hypothetical protein
MVTSTYSNGYLQRLGDKGRHNPYITSVNYAAGGVPTEIDRPTVKDTIDLDVRNRPLRIRAQGHPYSVLAGSGFAASWTGDHSGIYHELVYEPEAGSEGDTPGSTGISYAGWDSLFYAYDMAGNVKTIGAEQYNYDALSRLVNASIPGAGLTYSLGFAYDGLGNMAQQIRTLSSAPNSPIVRTYTTDWLTNRLTRQDVTGAVRSIRQGGNWQERWAGTSFSMGRPRRSDGRRIASAARRRVRLSVGETDRTFFFRDASGRVFEAVPATDGCDRHRLERDPIYA